MAGPNQTGDTDRKEEERLNDDLSLTTSQDDQNADPTEQTTLPPTDAIIADTVISDSDSDLDKEFKREQEHIKEELNAAQDAERSVMVGRDNNNIGETATSNAVLDATMAVTPGDTAQDIENDAHKNETQYGFGADAASKQMNDALSGAGEGKTQTTFTAMTREQIEERRKQDSMANIRAIAMTAQVAAAYAAIEEALQDMGIELTDLTNVFAEIDAQATEMLGSLGKEADIVETRLAELKQELEDLNNGESLLYTGDDPEMKAAQITLKEAEIANAEARLKLINETMASTRDQIQETKDKIEVAQERYDHLAEQERIAKLRGDPNNNLAEIQAQMELAKADVDAAKDSIEDLKDQARMTESISTLVGDLKGESESCGLTAAIEIEKAAQINARTALIETLTAATADGNLDEAELATITSGLNAAGISQESKSEFINSFTATNGTITVADAASPGGTTTLTGGDATAYLQSQWEEIKEEQADATENVQEKTADVMAAEAEVAALTAQVAAQQTALNAAEGTLETEQAESDAATAGAAEIKEVTLQYDSVYDYMSTNYSITILGVPMGKGQDIDDLDDNPNRILKDNDGNLVYVSPDTQEMYTLDIDSNGDQTTVPVSPVETIELYQKMYSENLLPRNFVKNEGGAYEEYSKSDTFAESISKSLLSGYMEADEQQALVDKAAEIERQDVVVAKAAADEAKVDLATAQGAVDSNQGDLTALQSKLAQAQERLRLANTAAAEFAAENAAIADAAANESSSADTAAASETANETDTQWETSETHNLDIPDHDLADAEVSRNAALEKIEMTALNGGTLSQEDYDTLKDAPGMSAEQLDDMMAKNKVTLDNQQAQTNTVTASNTMTAQHFGVQFNFDPIQTPTAPSPDQNGVSPATKYDSFADSMEFASTNDPSSQTNSYDSVAVKQGESPPAATSGFAAALEATPDESGSSAPKVDGMTPAQAEQLRLEENQRQAAQLAALTTSAGAGGGGGGVAGA